MGIRESIDKLSKMRPEDRVLTSDVAQHAVLMISGRAPFGITPHIQKLDAAIRAFCNAHWQHISDVNVVSRKRGFSHPGMRSYCMDRRILLTIYDGDNFVSINGPVADSEERPGISGINWNLPSATAAVEKLTEDFDPSCYVQDDSVTYVW